MSQRETFNRFDAEAYFVRRLKDHGKQVFAGMTDPDERRERIRYAIIEGGLEDGIIGRRPDRKPETYGQAFQRFYGEPLQPKGKKSCSA